MVAFLVGNVDDPSLAFLDGSGIHSSPNSTALPSSLCTERHATSACQCSTSASSMTSDSLIPGLPMDLAEKCLSRLSLVDMARLKSVSKAWLSSLSSHHLFRIREAEGASEPILFVLRSNPSVISGHIFHPRSKKWQPIPPMPASINSYGLACFAAVSVQRELFVVGGVQFDAQVYPMDVPVATNQMHVFDPISSKWRQASPMHFPRGNFACAEINSRVFVAGGDDRHAGQSGGGSRIATAEVYHPDSDTWQDLKSLNHARGGCVGFGVQSQFVVMGGHGRSERIGGMVPVDVHFTNAEVLKLDEEDGGWISTLPLWIEGERHRLGPVCQLGDDVFMLSGNCILKFDFKTRWWVRETNLQRDEGREASFFALDGEIYVVPSKPPAGRVGYAWQHCYEPKTRRWRTMKLDRRLWHVRSDGSFTPHTRVACGMNL